MVRGISKTVLQYFSNAIISSGHLTYTKVKSRYITIMTENIKIGTHDGCFHCDEALACFMLKTLPQYKDAIIIRSRDKGILDTCDIVVDVGGEYNPSKHRYDHHMRDFKETVSTVIKKPGYDWDIKLSSAGLIYCHFGCEIIKHLFPQLSDNVVETIFKRIYDKLIKEIDGIDNGIPMYKEEPLYRIVTDLSSRVDFLNVKWNDKDTNVDARFVKAMELTGQDFLQHINYAVNVWLPAKAIVQEAIAKRFEVDPSGEIIVLSQFVPWAEHIFEIEKEMNVQPPLKYLIFKNNNYRIRCVPVKPGSFVTRLFLPEAWAGLSGEELERACGIPGAEFVHSVRFIGGHSTLEGAVTMARKSLELGKKYDK